MTQVQALLAYIAFKNVLTADNRNAIIHRAFDYKMRASPSARSHLTRLLDVYIKIDGFQHASKAPYFKIAPTLERAIEKLPPLCGALLRIWRESHNNLEAATVDFLSENPVESVFADDKDFVNFSDEMNAVVARLQDKTQSEYTDSDFQIMICLLSNDSQITFPSDEIESDVDLKIAEEPCKSISIDNTNDNKSSTENSAIGFRSHIFIDWWKLLQELPATAGEWDELEDFMAAARQVADARRIAVENQSELKRQITEFYEEFCNELEFHGRETLFEHARALEITSLSAITNALGLLDELRIKLREFAELSEQPRAKSAAASRAQRERLDMLEAELLPVFSNFGRILQIENTAPNESTEIAAPVEDGTLIGSKTISTESADITVEPFPLNEGESLGMTEVLAALPYESPHDIQLTEIENIAAISADDEHLDKNPHVADNSEAIDIEIFADEITAIQVTTLVEQSSEFSAAEQLTENSNTSNQTNAQDEFNSTVTSSKSAAHNDENFAVEFEGDLIWTLLRERKTSLAFHLSRAVEEDGIHNGNLPPSWLLRALFCAARTRASYSDMIRQLSEDFAHFNQHYFPKSYNDYDYGLQFLALAAALRPALLAPATNARHIFYDLHLPEGFDNLYYAVEKIKQFSSLAQPLDASTLKKAGDVNIWSQELKNLQADIRSWREQAREVGISYKPARDVWQDWLRSKGLIGELLGDIERTNLTQSETTVLITRANEKVAQLRAHDDLDSKINETLRRLKHAGKEIERKVLRRLYVGASEAARLIEHWIILQNSSPHREKTFQQKQAADLFDDLHSRKSQIESEIAHFERIHESLFTQTGVGELRHMLEDLWRLFDDESTEGEMSLKDLLDADLLLMGAPFNENGVLTDSSEQLRQRIVSRLETQGDEWQTALRTYCERGDYESATRLVELASRRLSGSATINLDELIEKQREFWLNDLEHFREDLSHTRRIVETVADAGLFKESEQLESDAKFKDFDNLLSSEAARSADFENISSRLLRLDGRRYELLELRREAEERGNIERDRIKKRLIALNLSADDESKSRVADLLEKNDFWTVNEHLDALEAGESLPESNHNDSAFTRFYPEKLDEITRFLESKGTHGTQLYQTIVSELKSAARQPRHTVKNEVLDWTRILGKQAEQTAEMLETWYKLKNLPWQTIKSLQRNEVKYLEMLFDNLGFDVLEIKTEKQGKYIAGHIKCQVIADRQSCPSPHFGSDARGEYRVLLVADRPTAETLLNSVGETARQSVPTIVLYLNRMGGRTRRELAQLCRKRRRTFIVLDEAMLWFLTTEPSPRLRSFFETALPFTFSEPYTTTPGRVPTEMFFGRERERDSIVNKNGACFIYGGRQLGKTALLRHAERFFHSPENGQIALFFDINAHNICKDKEIDEIWGLLAKEFGKFGIVAPQNAGRLRAETLLDNLRQWLDTNERRRILLLLDEADNFLETDAGISKSNENSRLKGEFVRTTLLAGLMEQTEGRFKVVFAGLHNVQRTTKLVNHKLAHLGDPVCVGPLLVHGERHAARRLIERPLASLGYDLSPDLVTRIASQTNHFPSLIQLYCQRLLHHLNERAKNSDGVMPFEVQARHVDEAYNKELREDIRQRLILTLQLDKRYEVIGYALALESLYDREMAQRRGFSVDWIREQANLYWADGFRNNNSQEDIRVLLDEMKGLGLLRHIDDEHYALRSENVATLLGTEKKIADELTRERELPLVYEPATFRAVWSDNATAGNRRAPLTAQQFSALQQRSFDVHILYGTVAAGFDDVSAFLRHELKENFVLIDDVIDRQQFAKRLRTIIGRRNADLKLVAVTESCPWSAVWIDEARQQLRQLNSKEKFVQVVFLADATTAWNLLSSDDSDSEQLKKKDLKILNLRRWHDSAVRQWLEDLNMSLTEAERSEITRITGNWTSLLRRFDAKMNRRAANWKKALDMLDDELENQLGETVLLELGLANPIARQILQQIAELTRPGEAITPQFLSELIENLSLAEIETCFTWADALGLIILAENGWQLDPVVARALYNTTK